EGGRGQRDHPNWPGSKAPSTGDEIRGDADGRGCEERETEARAARYGGSFDDRAERVAYERDWGEKAEHNWADEGARTRQIPRAGKEVPVSDSDDQVLDREKQQPADEEAPGTHEDAGEGQACRRLHGVAANGLSRDRVGAGHAEAPSLQSRT